ncbi:hypothetical protein ADK77_10315 [Streptomyces antibioticus]|nr:hypothetical protein ADK77_10315 [Streptomyces antibioticus]
MLLLRLVTVGGPAASRHGPHRLAQRKAQRSDGLFRFLPLSGESFSTGVGLGEISGQSLILAFQVLDPADEVGVGRVVDFRTQGELDATLQNVALSFEFLDLFAGECEVGVQTGGRGPLGSGHCGCFPAALGLVAHGIADRSVDGGCVVDEPGRHVCFACHPGEGDALSGVEQVTDGALRADGLGFAVRLAGLA